jgi:hypothetical protein
MRMGFALSIFFILLISAGLAAEYRIGAGPYNVKFNSSQDVVILPPLPHEESGSYAGGWDIAIQDNMSHSIATIGIIEEDSIAIASNDAMDNILDSNFGGLSELKPKTNIKLNGIDGRMIEGYSPQIGMDVKQVIAPFNQFYDPFYKRMATKCFLLITGVDHPIYNDIIKSLNVTMNQSTNSA